MWLQWLGIKERSMAESLPESQPCWHTTPWDNREVGAAGFEAVAQIPHPSDLFKRKLIPHGHPGTLFKHKQQPSLGQSLMSLWEFQQVEVGIRSSYDNNWSSV